MLFIGHTVSKLEKVDSTNRYLRDLLAAGEVAEGFVVWALEQYEGRGQRGSSWFSQPGANLTLSIALRPAFLNASSQFWLTKSVALGVAEFVSNSLSAASIGDSEGPVRIKWANDIFVGDQKIAGILIENVLESSRLRYSIAGIGLNINQESFDPSLPNPVSLKLLTGREYDLNLCIEDLCISIEKRYLELRNSDFRQLDALYQKLLYRKDAWSQFALDGKQFRAMIKRVTPEGHLLLNAPELNTGRNDDELLRIKDIKQLQFL